MKLIFTNMRMNILNFLSIIFISLSLTACGSGGGSSDTSTTLPPDPGEAGMVTLEGIDSDNDGVRDDIQRWIALENDDVSEKAKQRFTNLTKAYVTLMVDENAGYEVEKNFVIEEYCLLEEFNDRDKYFRYLSKLGNTKERLLKQHKIIYQEFSYNPSLKDIKCD